MFTVYQRYCRWHTTRQAERAIADAEASLRIRPNDAHTLHTRGFAYLGKRNWDQAIADFEAVLRIDPNHSA